MIDFITQNKTLIIIAAIALLAFNNRDRFSFLGKWISAFFSLFNFNSKSKSATPDDRKDLYECLIQLQDYLAVCGVEREKMDSLTLAEVGKLTVSATTPLKPSQKGDSKFFGTIPESKQIPV
tara:strand:+ start:2116 stop:2481 length:366 start_codon:yes stop_codon:yes gene_type:complete